MKVTTAIMNAGNTPVLTVAALLGFLWAGYASYAPEDVNVGYTTKQRNAVQALVPCEKCKGAKSGKGYSAAQAKAMREVWQLSENDLASEVDLFDEKGNKL